MNTPVRIVDATLFALRIPFVETFAHSIQSRTYSDSIVVRLQTADGAVGYGEAVARPYVTGETVETCLQFMAETLWPAVQTTDYWPWEKRESPLAWLNRLGVIEAKLQRSAISGRKSQRDQIFRLI